jgi:hypothetical protein
MIKNIILHIKTRKGYTPSRTLGTVIGLILGMLILYFAATGIASGAATAGDAATSCPGWKSELSDMAGTDLC